jgi:phosphonate transport system substrate-binding protein
MKHEKLLYSVLYGEFDAGTAPLIDLEEMTVDGRLAPDDFTVLGRSPLAPYCTFAASRGVSDAWVGKVRAALLAMDDATTARAGGETLRVLKRARIAGYETLADADYDEIRRWARLAKMPPYEEY